MRKRKRTEDLLNRQTIKDIRDLGHGLGKGDGI